jgi:hypothetical protein
MDEEAFIAFLKGHGCPFNEKIAACGSSYRISAPQPL